jgi:hypothetical protein
MSRFKRVLRQRGAEFVVRHADANDRVIMSYTQYYGKIEPDHSSEPRQ